MPHRTQKFCTRMKRTFFTTQARWVLQGRVGQATFFPENRLNSASSAFFRLMWRILT